MSNKEKYRQFCSEEITIPIFSKDWWLDAVCGENNWDVVLVEKGGQIVASWPYYIKSKYGLKAISMPMLTQTMGTWIKYPSGQKYVKKLAYEKDICLELIMQLPNVDLFRQNFNYSFTNWLPFYWHSFVQTTRYTYIIDELADLDIVYSCFRSNIKTDIKKAQKLVQCYSDDDIRKFYSINKLTFERQNIKIPYDLRFLEQLDVACKKHKSRQIFYAQDEQGRIHAAIYLVWDDQTAYYLMSGGHPELRHSGATSLLIWEAIQFASTVTKKFDFEGSMIEPVERFFRAFGAIQKPYFTISKASRKMRIYQSLCQLGKAALKG